MSRKSHSSRNRGRGSFVVFGNEAAGSRLRGSKNTRLGVARLEWLEPRLALAYAVAEVPTTDFGPGVAHDPIKHGHGHSTVDAATNVSAAGAASASSVSPSGPTEGTSIEGINFDSNGTNNGGYLYIPPDPNGAVGPTQVVSIVNCTIQWHTKSGTLQGNEALGATGSGGAIAGSLFNSLSPVNGLFDPQVVYDQYAGRFVVSASEMVDSGSTHTSREMLAVSKDSNPNDGWYEETFNTKFTAVSYSGGPALDRWLDYPHIAVDDKAIYLTGNLFAFQSSGGPYGGERTFIIPKGTTGGLYAGGTSTATAYDPFAQAGISTYTTLQPAATFGPLSASQGTWLTGYGGIYNPSNNNDPLLLAIQITNPLTTPTFTAQYVDMGQIDSVFTTLPNASQKGSSEQLDVDDRRTFNAVWRNNELYTGFDVLPPNTTQQFTTAHWIEVNTSASTYTLTQQGNIDGSFAGTGGMTFYPTVMANAAGDIGVDFDVSSSTSYPSAAYTQQLTTDSQNTMEAPVVFAAGVDHYYRAFGGSANRWGDYSGIAVDPTDDSTFWAFNEYALTGGTVLGQFPSEQGRWGTRWAQFTTPAVTSSATTSVALDGSGNLVVTDIASGGKNDNLTLSYDASNSDYVITDPTAVFSTTVGTANGQHEVDVPASDVTGKIEVNTGAGNDTLTVDYTGGTPLPAAGLAYDGGTGTLDQLVVTGYSNVPVVSASTGAHSGTVQVGTGAPTISYTDLSPITLNGAASTLTLNLAGTGVANTDVLLGDDGGTGDPDGTQNAGFSAISGSTFEYTEFANPSQSLTVQLGGLGDTITVASLDSGFAPSGPGALVIDGGTGIDHFNVQATPTGGLAIDGKGGADVVIVGSTAPTLGGTLANIAGAVSVADTGSKAALTVDDSGDTAAKTAIAINKTTISNFAPAAINYTGTQISSITLEGGSGGNTFTFNTPAITNTFTVKAGTGDNTLEVNNATTKATDTWTIKGLNLGTVSKITFSSVAHLVGGAGPDVFKVLAAGKVTSIDGGGAPAGQGNWIDYSAFKTSVSVDLGAGAATNINGGANGALANIQDARGGSGNDTLTGDSQGNVLVGGAGNDVLNGGSGLSLLIGGKGADTINGGSGGDLIIGDYTKWDTNNTALMAILAEWQSADSYATRINDVENGGHLDTKYKLSYYSTSNTMGTVFDDATVDVLNGGTQSPNPDDDWFFQGIAAAGGSDQVNNFESGETVTTA